MHFLYVMSESDKAKMIDMGYKFIKHNHNSSVWVFENKDTVLNFGSDNELTKAGIKFVLSDVLTF